MDEDTSEEDAPCQCCGKKQGETRHVNWIKCSTCCAWFHCGCLGLSKRKAEESLNWVGPCCKDESQTDSMNGPVQNQRGSGGSQTRHQHAATDSTSLRDIAWGNLMSEEEIKRKIALIHSETTSWCKNIFVPTRGKPGKDMALELARLLDLFNNDTAWRNVALSMVNIFIPLMLQRPTRKSKPKTNSKYLEKRLELWLKGDLDAIMKEAREIQKRIQFKNGDPKKQRVKNFCHRMQEGKVAKAMRFLHNEVDDTEGVLPLTPEVLASLRAKHPPGGDLHQEAVIPGDTPDPPEVIYEAIDAEVIFSCAKKLSGSGGPTLVDSEVWKQLICSRFYGDASTRLAESIASLAKILCSRATEPEILRELLSNRLIPLDKGGGAVRPIGIGEVLRRIISKAVTRVLRNDIQKGAGNIQTCTGVESGIEAAIHATRETFNRETSDGLLLVDATNAFNTLNRKVALENMKTTCPAFYRFLNNCYQSPADLYIAGSSERLQSEEGVTQGDPAAMQMYGLAIRPLIDKISFEQGGDTIQTWYADDSAACGKLSKIKEWWDKLCTIGPSYGYHPNPSKTVLIVKDTSQLQEATALFEGSGVKITDQGERHLGAVVGTPEYRKAFVEEKVAKWVRDVEELTDIAEDHPQLAYSAFVKGVAHRWKYVQRTVPGISALFQPLEDCIRSRFLPSIIGRQISDWERRLFTLPLRWGGLGIQNPVVTADLEFSASETLSADLKDRIVQQDNTTQLENRQSASLKRSIKDARNLEYEELFDRLRTEAPESSKRPLDSSKEKGSYIWLSALPIKDLGYCLNKIEFQDAVALRYNQEIRGIPRYCVCGAKNNLDHLLCCKTGGYVAMRHDALRDTEADLMREAGARNVQVEPTLIPTRGDHLRAQTNRADQSRLDVAATGVWNSFERTFYDIRVTHPFAPSNCSKDLAQLYRHHEQQKKNMYEERVIENEKGSFCPLIFSTTGGTGKMCENHHRKIAEMIAQRRKERYSDVIAYVRTRLRFTLLRSVLMALRGTRAKHFTVSRPISEVSFGLIPSEPAYET